MNKQKNTNDLNGVALIVSGFLLVSMSLAGWWLGSLLDTHYHFSPWGKVSGLIIGTIAGFIDLFKIAARLLKGGDNDRK
jgi:ATP synthase protein I